MGQDQVWGAAGSTQQTASDNPADKPNRGKRRLVVTLLAVLLLWLVCVIIYQTHKPLPPGISYESPLHHTEDVRFLYDLTYPDPSGRVVAEQQIRQRIGEIVDESRRFLVIDLFLFNNYAHKGQQFPKVSEELTDKLVRHKKEFPDMDIVLITDPVNTSYGSAPNALLERLKTAGIRVIVTNLDPLRDPNPIYSAVWRTFIQWFGVTGKGWVPDLMATNGPKMTIRSYLKLLNIKANHRKVVLSEKRALILSGNVHDASAYHSNIAFEVGGPVIGDILKSEQAAADLSKGGPLPAYVPWQNPGADGGSIGIRYVTEGKTYQYVLQEIEAAQKGDTLWMGMFYMEDRKVLNALLSAAGRGVDIRLLLDPNNNAFGEKKIGIPNRQVVSMLAKRSKGKISIRWYHTTQEQYHTKMIYIEKPAGNSVIVGGAANMTPRNLNDYNLENDLWVSVPSGAPLDMQMRRYFDRLWNNRDGSFTLDLSAYQSAWYEDLIYRIQKAVRYTTF
ncbi:phospholipase D family protein [Paenibacillus sp. USDA918EY]|uniref:phospholipase D family protein n=1 Tax=Paenibacillus sp. USDA918EY TaxID=2689575 RepID=UPI00135701C5|nr:phospholipase D family protein [Paenibacillus sp. USDA918EY]